MLQCYNNKRNICNNSVTITKDKKTMISDSYVLWKISDPLKFAQTLNSSVESGESRINTAVYNAKGGSARPHGSPHRRNNDRPECRREGICRIAPYG